MPRKKHYILGTAGHIDHGKSSLVRALTGTDPDRLPEEQRRGVTIELGFAHLSLPLSADAEGGLELGIVDVPGHADFVNNMVAGVGGMDVALFVVAADDGQVLPSSHAVEGILPTGGGGGGRRRRRRGGGRALAVSVVALAALTVDR